MKLIVIGSGSGGYVAAIRAAQLGADVTVVERQDLGGTCLNAGCIPTKCLLHSAGLLEELRTRGADLGIDAGQVKVNFPQVVAHKNEITKKLTGGIAGLFSANRIQRVDGEASFLGPKRLQVKKADGSTQEMAADAILVATGSVNAQPPIPGIQGNPHCIDSTAALSLEAPPASMAVIGGGVIGLELACAYAAFGTKVTVIEAMDRMLPMLDADILQVGITHLERMGITFSLGAHVEAIQPSPLGARTVYTQKNGQSASIETEKVLVAVGRRANTASLNLEAGKLDHNRGAILVNDRMETSVPGVYAAGDCVYGHPQLAHTASMMGEVAAENIMGLRSTYDESTNPSCVYIEPEVASVGLTEEQCKANKIGYVVGRFPMMANGKALILGGGEGLVKIVAGEQHKEVLGMQIIGPRATDLISEGALAIRLEATLDELSSTIHSHPTVTEAIREAALHAEKRAIHIKN